MINNPKISVIIPVYNTALYLERCIGSVLKNTFHDFEIICVNDGSTDNSLEILNGLAAKDSRIHVIDQENGGVSSARNHGMDEANGEYICFIDSDDWIHPQFFEILVSEAEKSNSLLTIAHFRQTYEYSNIFENLSPPFSSKIIPVTEAFSTDGNLRRAVWARLYKKEHIKDIRFPLDIQYGEDQIFNLLVGSNFSSESIAVLDMPLYFYYQARTDSLVKTKNIEAEYKMGCWYLENLNLFGEKKFVITSTLSALLSYRYECGFSSEAKLNKRKANSKLKIALHLMFHERDLPVFLKLKYSVLSLSSHLYRTILIMRDPSYLHYEKILQQRNK